jgi:hypothetical protein
LRTDFLRVEALALVFLRAEALVCFLRAVVAFLRAETLVFLGACLAFLGAG